MSTREHEGRALVDARSQGGRCEVCGRLGSNVHHRMRQGRPWHAANLLRVCGAGNVSGCHGWIETHPTYSTALGLIVPRGHDPQVVPAFCSPVGLWVGWWLPDDEGMWLPRTITDRRRAAPVALLDLKAAMNAVLDHIDALRDAE